jgi:hypothetical protein
MSDPLLTMPSTGTNTSLIAHPQGRSSSAASELTQTVGRGGGTAMGSISTYAKPTARLRRKPARRARVPSRRSRREGNEQLVHRGLSRDERRLPFSLWRGCDLLGRISPLTRVRRAASERHISRNRRFVADGSSTGTPSTFATTFAVGCASECSASTPPKPKSPVTPSAAGDPRPPRSPNSNLVDQRVAVVTDPTQDRTDRFGRTLAYLVRADVWDYSVEAARAGAAHSYIYGGRPESLVTTR